MSYIIKWHDDEMTRAEVTRRHWFRKDLVAEVALLLPPGSMGRDHEGIFYYSGTNIKVEGAHVVYRDDGPNTHGGLQKKLLGLRSKVRADRIARAARAARAKREAQWAAKEKERQSVWREKTGLPRARLLP